MRQAACHRLPRPSREWLASYAWLRSRLPGHTNKAVRASQIRDAARRPPTASTEQR
jgi:hypothetical protein